MPEACEKSAPPNPQPARSHGKVRQARRRLKRGLADVASGAAQHAGGDGSLDGGAQQAPPPSRERLSSSVTDPLGQAPGTLPSQGGNELNGIRTPSTKHFHSEAQELAQPALFDLRVIGLVLSVGPSYRRTVPPSGAGAGNSRARDRGDARGVTEQWQPAMNRKTRHHQIKTPCIGRRNGDVGIPQHPLDVPVRDLAPGLLKHLAPSGHNGAMPGACARSSGAGRTMVTVSVNLAAATFAPFPERVHSHAQTSAHGAQHLRIGHAKGRGSRDCTEPTASEGTGARSQPSPGGQRTPARTTADRSNHSMEQRSVFDLLQNATGVKLPPVWYVVGARLLVWLGSRGKGASAEFVP